MKRFLISASELLCVILLAVFIVYVSSQEKISDVSFESVSSSVLEAFDTDGLTERDGLKLKKEFSLDFQQFKAFSYYSSDSVMDVREVLLIQLGDLSEQESVTEALKKYVTEKQRVFDGYAPKESALLSAHILVSKGGYVLFCVGECADTASKAFHSVV